MFLSGLRSAIFPRQTGGRKRIKPVFLPEDLPRCTDAACSPFLLLSLPFRGELSSAKLTKDLFTPELFPNIIFLVKANFIRFLLDRREGLSFNIFGTKGKSWEDV